MKARECDQVFMSPVWSPSSPRCASGGEEGGVRGIEGGGLNRGEGGERCGAPYQVMVRLGGRLKHGA